ncbi:hypothetical protein K3888_13295 [Dietzia aurantiaca]|uniref:hypothetical protein n=1 Tax=Dietzia aurantiaca TaxID=983873 RepID=UPI001E3EC719|nr:hypothetical protein [Dietzia aurantiaca]MCD2263675.1 hypothetical protein [Dietzia aurantiaca]
MDDELDLVTAAEDAEKVRGEHFTVWWPEVDRLANAGRWGDYEALLCEMRDATERGSELAGWTLAPRPTLSLADLYEQRGDTERAIAELERFLNAIVRYRQVEPEGGDTGQQRATERLQRLREG